MKSYPFLVAGLLVSVVLVNWWNNTREPVEYVSITEGETISAVTSAMLNKLGTDCLTDGYFKLGPHNFMCVYLGADDDGQSKR